LRFPDPAEQDMQPQTSTRCPDHLLEQMGWVRELARSLVRDPNVAEDVSQQTFLHALSSPPSEALGVERMRLWLARVTRRFAWRTNRSQARRARRERVAARPEAQTSTLEIVSRGALQGQLVSAVMGLPEPYRATILYRYLDSLTTAEIAEKCGVSQAAVRQRIVRGLERLRAELDSEHGGDRGAWLALLTPFAGRAHRPGAGLAGAAGIVVCIALLAIATTQRRTQEAASAIAPEPALVGPGVTASIELVDASDSLSGRRALPVQVPRASTALAEAHDHLTTTDPHTDNNMKLALRSLLLASALSSPAAAGDLLVTQITPSRVIKVDGNTGAILDSNYIDIGNLVGFGSGFHETRDGVNTANGEIWISDSTAQAVYRFTSDGTTYLGSLPTGSCGGLEIANNTLWDTESGGAAGQAAVQYDMTSFNMLNSVGLTSPKDAYLYNGALLVSQFNGTIMSIDPSSGALNGTFANPGATLYQMRRLASGNLLVARWGPPGLFEISPTGTLLATLPFSVGQPEGVAELGNGNYLVSTQQGLYSYDPVSHVATLIDSHPALFIFDAPVVTTGLAYCDPGSAGVMACPCSNPPSGTGRGCNNSAATGGANIVGAGSALLSADSVVFTTSSQTANGTTILLQGTVNVPAGTGFGQGVRCVGGALKRLYVKSPGGSGGISAPVGADPSVTARSAALGDPISSGQHRFYMAYYRDPSVLGGCPALSTYNATNALDLTWN